MWILVSFPPSLPPGGMEAAKPSCIAPVVGKKEGVLPGFTQDKLSFVCTYE